MSDEFKDPRDSDELEIEIKTFAAGNVWAEDVFRFNYDFSSSVLVSRTAINPNGY